MSRKWQRWPNHASTASFATGVKASVPGVGVSLLFSFLSVPLSSYAIGVVRMQRLNDQAIEAELKKAHTHTRSHTNTYMKKKEKCNSDLTFYL